MENQDDIPEVSSTKKLTEQQVKKRLKSKSKGDLIKFVLHLLRTNDNLEKNQKD